jgi:hypothetical protein
MEYSFEEVRRVACAVPLMLVQQAVGQRCIDARERGG